MICLVSCNNGNIASKHSMPIVEFLSDTLLIDNVYNKNISISVENENVMTFNGREKLISISLLDVVRKCKDKCETALRALKNNNVLQIKVVIKNEIDTIYNYNISPIYDEDNAFSISGQCAPLTSKFSNSTQTVDIKKWLFRKKEHLDNENIHVLCRLVNQLSRTNTIEYVTNSIIPVIHSFSGLKYKVNSSITADYYVLYACSSTKEIDEFIEDIISNDFDLCVRTLNEEMDCYRQSESNGYKCICLIAINSDWSYKIQPLGLIVIDNLAPVTDIFSYVNSNAVSSLSFPNNVSVLFPSNIPQIDGFCNVKVVHWAGSGISCNCTFSIDFSGDIKSVVIHRRNKLAKYLTTEKKTIELNKVSVPYIFTYELHLDDGDNFIPITIYDYHGNKTDYKINIRAEFVYRDSPDINIDNNIDIDIY